MNSKTKKIATIGLLIALGVILTFIKIYQLPYGGAITLAGMVPVVILGYKYGVKWGLFAGLIFSIIQMILGATMSQAFAGMYDPEHVGASVGKIIAMAFLDYIVAFSMVGVSGLFKGKIKNDTLAIALGGGTAVFLRFVAHFLSGVILWGSYAEWFFTEVMVNDTGKSILANYSGIKLAAIYSLIYNGSFMFPEIIITVFAVTILMAVKPLRRLITEENA